MKKILLSMVAAAAVLSANAQQRLVLYEEFSGENCGPCALYNPGLMTLLNANVTKAILIKYQSPIPSGGPIYAQNTPDVSARITYYGVNSAPNGRIDGANGDNIANHNQADIDAAYNMATPFTMTTTHTYSSDLDSIFITVVVTATGGAFNGSQMYLRTALVEHLVFDAPPGSNGETDFHNVMREMYPISGGALGTSVPATWTMGQTATYNISGPVPSYVGDKTDDGTFVIAWLQNDATKVVAQASKSTPALIPLDAKSDGVTVPSTFVCTATTASVVPTVAVKNQGTTTLTSANIYTSIDGAAWTLALAWTGSLATGASANVALPAVSLTPGSHQIRDSITMPNTTADINPANNKSSIFVTVKNSNATPLNITTSFENGGNLPTDWVLYDAAGNGLNWYCASGTGNIGHNNTTYVIYHRNFDFASGEVNYAILPNPDMSGYAEALDFWVAYAQYAAENDKLEVVWSNNCGQSWTSIWSQQGSTLATAPPVTTLFIPTQAQWVMKSVNVSSVPAGAMIAFRATSAYGNNLFIDDVNMRTGYATGVEAFTTTNAEMSLFPNPATDKATLSFSLTNSSNVEVSIVDALGRTVATVVNSTMDKGQQKVDISTANYASGVYNVIVKTESGTVTQRLTVTK